MKRLKVVRDTFTENTTIGKLYVDGVYFCETLEDKDRGMDQSLTLEQNKLLKVKAETCIPYGRYKGIVNMSPAKKRFLPRLIDVPAFQGILMHKGNTKKDSLGCIILGTTRGVDAVYQSTAKELKLLELIPAGTEFEIEITKASKSL